MVLRRLSVSLLALLALPQVAQACSGCGCTLSTDGAALSDANEPGFRMDARVDSVDQRNARQGAKKADTSGFEAAGVEAERRTRNTYYTLGLDYASTHDWGVNLAVPLLSRYHETYQNATPGHLSVSDYTKLSDVRVLGRYQGLTDSRNYGVLFGLKLPTGSTKTSFRDDDGPLDRSLQPGTGTTDGLFGFSQQGRFSEAFGWFASELYQRALNEHSDYRPGSTLNVNVGVRYAIDQTFVPQLQLNTQQKWRDSGAAGDAANSGGELVYVSPGLGVNLTADTTAYVFMQVPVYNRVGGVQLTPSYTATVGISHTF